MTVSASIREARQELAGDEVVVYYRLTVAEAEADERVRAALAEDPRTLGAAHLAQEAGFDVELEAQEWDNGEINTTWHVTVPAELDAELLALVWAEEGGMLEYTLTRSTTHPGWQLTTWARDGGPWGHRDVVGDASGAFDTSFRGAGVPLTGLTQVMFRDGRVLVREGAKRIAHNPGKNAGLKRRLMR